MNNMLLKLKRILNTYADDELEEIELWIDNKKNISLIAVEEDSITLVTDIDKLQINNEKW